MKRYFGVAVSVAVLAWATAAQAQVSITGGIAGMVQDSTDALVPGATVSLVDEGTGAKKTAVTDANGAFAFRDLNFGSYQVTVKLPGFQSAVYNKVIVEAGRTTDIRVRLAVGIIGESITVEGKSPVLEMSSNVISSTLSNKDVNELPIAGRNAFTFARLVPGAVAPQGTGSTHFNGMPGGTINPTIDGVNNSSNGFKSGGTSFFGTVPARLGAVEQVTVETAGLGGDDGVTGGVNLKFVTRRGTNKYTGSFFEQYRTDKLNANTFGNVARGLAKPELRRHDFGGNFGGPLIAQQIVRVRELRGGIPADVAEPHEHRPHRGGAAGNLQLRHGRRRAAVGQRLRVGRRRWIPVNSRPDDRCPARTTGIGPCIRQRRAGQQPPHGNPDVARAAETDQLLPNGQTRLPDHQQPVRHDQLQPVQPGRTRPSGVADSWLPDQRRHVRLGLVGVVDGHELDNRLQHAQRVAFRHPAQRRHERSRPPG